MEVILNIGLAREGASDIAKNAVINETDAAFRGAAYVYRFHESDTETTAVVYADDNGLDANQVSLIVDRLARKLGQDCIAVYYPEAGHGALVGPNAAKWGEFNPSFFLLRDGSRLG